MSPQKSAHFSAIEYSAEALAAAFGLGHYVRRQGPIVISAKSEPEPDLVVVEGDKSAFVGRHPRADRVRLLVEVSDATLSLIGLLRRDHGGVVLDGSQAKTDNYDAGLTTTPDTLTFRTPDYTSNPGQRIWLSR